MAASILNSASSLCILLTVNSALAGDVASRHIGVPNVGSFDWTLSEDVSAHTTTFTIKVDVFGFQDNGSGHVQDQGFHTIIDHIIHTGLVPGIAGQLNYQVDVWSAGIGCRPGGGPFTAISSSGWLIAKDDLSKAAIGEKRKLNDIVAEQFGLSGTCDAWGLRP